MHPTNLWYKFDLHWRKIAQILTISCVYNFFLKVVWNRQFKHLRFVYILIMAISLFQYPIFSQTKVYNRRFLENYDDKDIHFGFYFGTGFSRFNVKHSEFFLDPANNIVSVTSPSKFAFKVGMVVNKYLNKRWDVRTTPGINITSKQLDYEEFNNNTISDTRDLDFFELPVLFKYKSERRKNSRMYMVAGGNFLIETNIKKGQAALKSNLPSKTADFCVEYGFGYEQFLEFGKFTGELRFSHGIKNLFESDATKPYRQSLDGLKSHTVTVYLYFE